MNRRSFLQVGLASAAALIGYSVVANGEERRRGGGAAAGAAAGAVLLDPNESGAKAVNYVHVNTQVTDAKLKTDRTGVKFKDQHCKNCAFYLKDKETTAGGKKAAPCQMPFANKKVVAAEGWCTSWAKKA